MCDPEHYDFGDLNLDFLDSAPSTQENPCVPKGVCSPSKIITNQPSPPSNGSQTVEIDGRIYRVKELVKQIATTDFCIEQIKALEKERKALQDQLSEFKVNADNIRQLYIQENVERKRLELETKELSTKCERWQTELATKTLFLDQLESKLDNMNNLPVEYNELLVGYLRLCNKFEEDAAVKLPNAAVAWANKLRQYCKQKSIRIPESVKRSPKERRPKNAKKDTCIQCEVWRTAPVAAPSPSPVLQTVIPKEMRSQGTQYINTTTTRSTSTSTNIMKRTVGTNFPERSLPHFEDIMKDMLKWDIQPLSPICASQIDAEVPANRAQTTKSIGTCTLICNIHRQVDYIASNQSLLTSIKRSNSRPPSRVMLESIKHEMISPPPTISSSPAAAAANFARSSSLGAINCSSLGAATTTTTFEDLWQVFGQMVLGLLSGRQREGDTVIQNLITDSSNAYNQEEFYRWLRVMSADALQETQQCTESSGTAAIHLNKDTNQQNIIGTNAAAECLWRQKSHKGKISNVNLSPSDCPRRNSSLHQAVLPKTEQYSNEYHKKKSKTDRSEKIVNEILKLFAAAETTEEMKIKIHKLIKRKNKPQKVDRKTVVAEQRDITDDVKSTILSHKSEQTQNPEENEIIFNSTNINTALLERAKSESNLEKNKENESLKLSNISEDGNDSRKMSADVNDTKTSVPPTNEFAENAVDFLMQLSKITTGLDGDISIPQSIDDKSTCFKTPLIQIQHNNFATKTSTLDSEKFKNKQNFSDFFGCERETLDDGDGGRDDENLKTEEIGTNEHSSQPQVIYQRMHESDYRAMTDFSNNDRAANKLIKQNVNNNSNEPDIEQYPLNDVQLAQARLYQDNIESTEYKNSPEERRLKIEVESNELRSSKPHNIYHNMQESNNYIVLKADSNDSRVEEKSIKWNISQDYVERQYPLTNAQLSQASLYQGRIKSPDYKNSREEVRYKNEKEKNELTSQPHIIYHNIPESQYRRTPEISNNNDRVEENFIKPNIKEDDLLANRYPPLTDVQLSQHSLLYHESETTPKQIIYKTEVESKELSSQAQIIYHNMPESGFRERNLMPETIEIMKPYEKQVIHEYKSTKIRDHNYHQQLVSFRNSNFLNGSPECVILQPALDINQQVYTENQCYQLDVKAVNDSIMYQTMPNTQKFHELSQINRQASEVFFEGDFGSQQAEGDEESPQLIGELIETNAESAELIGELIETNAESAELIGELIETNAESAELIGELIETTKELPEVEAIQRIQDEHTEVGTHENSAQMVEDKAEICYLECSQDVDVNCKTMPAEDQDSAKNEVIVEVWDAVNECNLVIDECETNKNTRSKENDMEKETNKSTTPTLDSAAVEFLTPKRKTQNSSNERLSIIGLFSPTTDGRKSSEIILPHSSTTTFSDKAALRLSDNDEHEVFENYLSHILNEVAPRNVSPISIISSSPITSLTSPLKEQQPKKRGRKRKNVEMCSPLAVSPAAAPTEPVATKRSERLRLKRKIAETILDTNSTLVRNTLGKYTTKRAYKKRQTISEAVEKLDTTESPSVEDTPKPEINLGFFRERFLALEDVSPLTLVKKENEKESKVAELKRLLNDNGTRDESVGKFIGAKAQQNQGDNEMDKIEDFQKYQNCDNVHYRSADSVNTLSLATLSPTSPSQPRSPAHYDSPASPTIPTIECETPALTTLHQRRPPALLKALQYESTTQLTSTHSNSDSTASPIPALRDSPASPIPSLRDSPASPTGRACSPINIPLQLDAAVMAKAKNSLIQQLTINYREDLHKLIEASGGKKGTTAAKPLQKSLCQRIQEFLRNTDEAEDVDTSVVALMNEMHFITQNLSEILSAIIVAIQTVPRPEAELACPVTEVPAKYLGKQHRRMSFVLRHLQALQPFFIVQLMGQIESVIFNFDTSIKLSLDAILNLTQLYLLAISIQLPTISVNPARLFVAKCLYFYNLKAIPMIYEVLCCFPTTLPHREEQAYDRSDALITVIQHLLMSTKYDMDKRDLRTRELLSKLRFEYHFEPFKPERTEVLTNLVDKIKAGKVENLPYAFALFCKRLPQAKVEEDVLRAQLLPLTHEYYRQLDESDAHDVSIMCLLETISMIIKPFSIDTDIDMYLRIFSRFLNATERPRIQEAAVQAILRCQRFGYVNCFYALQLFRPRHELQAQTKAMLQTFVYRKTAKFWRTVNKTASFFIECSSN